MRKSSGRGVDRSRPALRNMFSMPLGVQISSRSAVGEVIRYPCGMDFVLAGVHVVRRRLASADGEAAHGELPVGGGAVQQHREHPTVEPFKSLLPAGLGEVGHAHDRYFSGVSWWVS
jgi:hypothetical protein